MFKNTQHIINKVEEVSKDILSGSDFTDHLRSLYYFVSREIVSSNQDENLSSRTIQTVKSAFRKIDKEYEFGQTYGVLNSYRKRTHYDGGIIPRKDYNNIAEKCIEDYNAFVAWIQQAERLNAIDDLLIPESILTFVKESNTFLTIDELTSKAKDKRIAKNLEAIIDDHKRMKSSLVATQAENEKLKRDLMATRAENKIMSENLQLSLADKERMTKQLDSTIIEKHKIKESLEAARAELKLNEAKPGYEQNLAKASTLQKQIEKLERRQAKMSEESQYLVKKIDISNSEIKAIEENINNSVIRERQLTDAIESSSLKLSDIDSELARKHNKKTELDAELNEKKTELTELSRKTNALRILSKEAKVKTYSKKWKKNKLEIRGYYCPCDFIKKGNGFVVHGSKLGSNVKCEHKYKRELSVILGMVQRAILYSKSSFVSMWEDSNRKTIDGSLLLRAEILILVLIKDNIIKGQNISILLPEIETETLSLAVADINWYLEAICHLAGTEYTPFNLTNKPMSPVLARYYSEGRSTDTAEADVAINDLNTAEQNSERITWWESNLLYSISDANKYYLERLAKEFFPSSDYFGLRPGQIEAIASAISKSKHNLCIMPTGSGKSFVYYFMAMMFSRPTLIVSPTELLIRNQIDNLEKYHHIDDVVHLPEGVDYSAFIPSNKLIYITPRVMRDYSLMIRFAESDKKFPLGAVVLDEIHCISSWSHDFRPDYVILAMNVVKFFETPLIRGYTATANYTVVTDLLNQLGIKNEDLMQPLELRKNNYVFSLFKCIDESEFWEKSKWISEKKVFTDEKIIGFAKSHIQAENVCELLPPDIQFKTITYNENDEYLKIKNFENGQHNLIISSSDLGVGLDLRNIKHTIHYGIPTSISNFVQEIGRAGREGEEAHSSVLFMDYSAGGADIDFLFSTKETNEILQNIPSSSSNDNILALHKVIHIPFEKTALTEKLSTVITSLRTENDYVLWGAQISDEISVDKQLWEHQLCLYILLRIGLIDNWYIKYISERDKEITFFIELEREPSLTTMKEKFAAYLTSLGVFSETNHKLQYVQSDMDLVQLYIDWHYEKLIKKHREELKNTFRFFNNMASASNEHILNRLQNYFSLSLIFVEKVRDDLMQRSIEEIFELAESDYSAGYQDAVQIAIERQYHVNMEVFLLFYDLLNTKKVTALGARIMKLIEQLNDREGLINKLIELYGSIEPISRLEIIQSLILLTSEKEAINHIYTTNVKDYVYYGILSYRINQSLKGEKESV